MQGIVSILRSDNPEKPTKAASLRRTLSADMSSKRWLADNGSPAMKKIASFEQIAVDSSNSSSESDDEDCDHVIGKQGDELPTRMDIWTAIMSQKKQDDSVMLPPPYVHPLVKKSASSLSEKSLKVCTESLGSETGSDVFSSYPSSDPDTDVDVNLDEQQEQSDDHKVVKIACFPTKKPQPTTTNTTAARSFPPPLPSLAAARTDGPSLHMHSRRVDGRLVLEAVSVPPQKYFEAQRQDGRFLLTLINNPEELPSGNGSSDEKTPLEEQKDEIFTGAGIFKHRQINHTSVLINVHKSTVTIKKMTKRGNENSINSWSQKLNTKMVSNHLSKLEVVEEEEASPITQSLTLPLPPPPRKAGLPPLPPSPAAATSFNSYQYFWRAKPTVASVIDPLITQHRPPTKTKDLVLLRDNKVDCLIPSLKGCKEPRRSIVMWEPFCIATS